MSHHTSFIYTRFIMLKYFLCHALVLMHWIQSLFRLCGIISFTAFFQDSGILYNLEAIV